MGGVVNRDFAEGAVLGFVGGGINFVKIGEKKWRFVGSKLGQANALVTV